MRVQHFLNNPAKSTISQLQLRVESAHGKEECPSARLTPPLRFSGPREKLMPTPVRGFSSKRKMRLSKRPNLAFSQCLEHQDPFLLLGHGLSRRESFNHIGAQVGVLSSHKNKAQNQYHTKSTSTRYEFGWSSRRMERGVWNNAGRAATTNSI